MSEEVDVVVIGLGVGGEELGGKLAEAGLSVVGVERPAMPGTRRVSAMRFAARIIILLGTQPQ